MLAQGNRYITSTCTFLAGECSVGRRGKTELMAKNRRRSERVIPFVSDEEAVVIRAEGMTPLLAKMINLSETGTLVYVFGDGDGSLEVGSSKKLAVYHQGKVFEVPAAVARKDGRMIGFHFANPSADVLRDIQNKLIRMEIEWMRLSRRT